MKYTPIILICSIIAFTTCDIINPCGTSKESFLNNYNSLVQEVKEKDLKYDDRAWEHYDRQFKKMVENCYEKYQPDMTATEEVDFWSNALAYYYYRYGTDMVTVLSDSSNELSVTISENVEKAIDNPSVVLRKLLGKEKMKELEGLFDDLEKDLEKWGEKLKNLFDK